MSPSGEAFSAALLHFVWQGIVVAILLSISLFLLRHRSAHARYVASCFALSVLAVLPPITTFALYADVLPAGRATSSVVSTVLAAIEWSPSGASTPITSEAAQASWLAFLQRWALPFWSAGVLVFSLRLVVGAAHTLALGRSNEPAEASLVAAVRRLATRLGVDRLVRVQLSPRVESPAVIGWLRPIILLPPASLLGLTSDQLETILAHELAHIRRHDYLVNIMQLVVETVLFYHPAVWWTSRQIRRERELCCDDVAVRLCGDPVFYARALAALEKLRLYAPSLAMGSTRGPLLYRVQRLLGATTTVVGPSRWPGIVAISLGLACAALNVSWLRAQSQSAARPEFEVASIKPTKFVPGLMGVKFLPGGRVSVTQAGLWLLIPVAYDISQQQLDWPTALRPMLNEFYNIEAKAPLNAIPQGATPRVVHQQLRLMLQTLLEDRFKLKFHRESKELPVFDLLVAKNGPKLEKAADRDCTESPSTPSPCHVLSGGPASGHIGKTLSMSDLADNLSMFVGRLVVDRTGIRGNFDIQLPPWSRGAQVTPQAADDGREAAPDPSSPSIFAVLQEQLGLRLESSKSRLDVLVIDHVKKPTED